MVRQYDVLTGRYGTGEGEPESLMSGPAGGVVPSRRRLGSTFCSVARYCSHSWWLITMYYLVLRSIAL